MFSDRHLLGHASISSANTTYSSDRIGGTAGHWPFVVTHAVVPASLDMGVGHNRCEVLQIPGHERCL